MFCYNIHLLNKHFLFCILQFLQGIASTVSLVMSGYSLAYAIGETWQWEHIIIVACIGTTIICNSIKDALIANPEVLMNKKELDEKKKKEKEKEQHPTYIDI